jgi:hypothetical protein
MKRIKPKDEELKRIHRKALMFNTKELKVFDYYCEKYDIENMSKFMRESIISTILKRLDEDSPTLFDDPNPNLFNGNGNGKS